MTDRPVIAAQPSQPPCVGTSRATGDPSKPDPLAVSDLSVVYGDHTAVQSISFSVARGEIVAIVGPNGAGKSSTIRAIAGLMPVGGTVRIGGFSAGTAQARERLRWAPQANAVTPELTVRENLSFVERLLGRYGRTAADAANLMDLTGMWDVPACKLSGGYFRRLHVASALVGEPELLVLDEPSVGMDLESRREFLAVVESIAGLGTGVVYATHQLDEVDALADRLILLQAGVILLDANPYAFRQRLDQTLVSIIGDGADEVAVGPHVATLERNRQKCSYLLSGASQMASLSELFRTAGERLTIEVRPPTLEESIWSLLRYQEGG